MLEACQEDPGAVSLKGMGDTGVQSDGHKLGPHVLTSEHCHKLISLLNKKGHHHGVGAKEETSNGLQPVVMLAQVLVQSDKNDGKCLSNNSSVWVLDSGATHHIACHLSVFDSYSPISDISVKMPNNVLALATHVG